MGPKHPWIARLVVCIAMLLLAFVGLIFSSLSEEGGWDYWKWIVFVYAILALWLSWYLRRKNSSLSLVTIWHEVLHWLCLIASATLISHFLNVGVLSRFLAGLMVLTLIIQALFFAGVYIETSFFLIGIVLAVFAWSVAFTVEYVFLYTAIPALLLGIGAIVWYLHHLYKKSKPPEAKVNPNISDEEKS